MGYYTGYDLKWKPPVNLIGIDDLIGAYIESHEGMDNALEPSGSEKESTTWYDHEEDMIEMSKVFPGIIFTLHGEGEESGDIWNKYFKDGVMQVAKATITVEECNL